MILKQTWQAILARKLKTTPKSFLLMGLSLSISSDCKGTDGSSLIFFVISSVEV